MAGRGGAGGKAGAGEGEAQGDYCGRFVRTVFAQPYGTTPRNST